MRLDEIYKKRLTFKRARLMYFRFSLLQVSAATKSYSYVENAGESFSVSSNVSFSDYFRNTLR